MLYPFSLTLDLYIQAESFEEAKKLAEAEKKIMLCVFDYGLPINNVIYYPHTNTLSFNWNGYGEKNHTGRV